MRRPPRGQKGRDTCGFPSSLDSYLSLVCQSDANQRPATAPKNRNGSRVTSAYLSPPFRSSQIAYCYTCGLINAECGITVPHNSLTRYTVRHLRIKRLVQFIFADPIYHNALTNCAALSCRALRRVARMCSRTVSGTAYRFRHGSTLCSPTVEKILCRSLFSEQSHVGNLRQTLQGKRGDSQEGGKP